MLACVNRIVNGISYGIHSNAWSAVFECVLGIRDGVETARKKPHFCIRRKNGPPPRKLRHPPQQRHFCVSAAGEEITGCFVNSTPVTIAFRI